MPSPSLSPGSPARLEILDVLRGVAIVLVLGRHMTPLPDSVGTTTRFWMHLWLDCGGVGVDLFFVLSGFLVSGLLFREYQAHQRIRLSQFLIRRGFKIYPSFYVFLFGMIGIFALTGRYFSVRQILVESLFLQNYFTEKIWGHTWSLAVEEHFYLGLGAWLTWLSGRGRADPLKSVPATCAVLGIVVLLIRCGQTALWPDSMLPHGQTHARVDALLSGVCLSWFYTYQPVAFARFFRRKALIAFAATLCLLPRPVIVSVALATGDDWWMKVDNVVMMSVGYTLAYLGICGLMGLLLTASVPLTRRICQLGRPLRFIGIHSYQIYLWHLVVHLWSPPFARIFLGRNVGPVGEFWFYFVASIPVGALMTVLIERPFLRMRDRITASRAMSLAPLIADPAPPESEAREVLELRPLQEVAPVQ